MFHDAGDPWSGQWGQVGVRVQRSAWLRWCSAEVRMREAYRALEEAEQRGASEGELARLEDEFQCEVAGQAAAHSRLSRLDGVGVR